MCSRAGSDSETGVRLGRDQAARARCAGRLLLLGRAFIRARGDANLAGHDRSATSPPPSASRSSTCRRRCVCCSRVLVGIHFVRASTCSAPTPISSCPDASPSSRRGSPRRRSSARCCRAATAAAVWSFVTYAFLHADWAMSASTRSGSRPSAARSPGASGRRASCCSRRPGRSPGRSLHLLIHPDEHDADGRRFGGDLGAHGRRQPLRLRRRRPARAVRAGAPTPIGGRRRRSSASSATGACHLPRACGSASTSSSGCSAPSSGLASGAIAWEAHIGGFLAGLLLFPLFDPVEPARYGDVRDPIRAAIVACILSIGARAPHRCHIGAGRGSVAAPVGPSGDPAQRRTPATDRGG